MKLAVSVPDTVLEEKESQRDKTVKLGLIARACAIYGVDVIEVFRDMKGRGEQAAICEVLEYLETPQYLRKRMYPLDDTLKYAGILPPLRIPSHKPRIPVEALKVGEVREGIANADGTVDVGLEVAPRLRGKAVPGRRVTVKVSTLNPLSADVVDRQDSGVYWGYTVERKSVADVFGDSRFDVKIATSRLGDPLWTTVGRLKESVRASGSVKLVFGSPSRGLFEIVGKGLTKMADYVVNLFPEQHVETVRTEEAIFAGLGLVGLLMAEKA